MKQFTFDMGLVAEDLADMSGSAGRQDIAIVDYKPSLTIDPLYASSYTTLRSALTSQPFFIQLGGGVIGATNEGTTILPSMAIYCPQVQFVSADATADGNQIRQPITMRVSDQLIHSGSASRMVVIGRS